ncbi:MAG: DUF7305 domain-containing protein [Halothermotrichaceae bacterium]
MFEIFKIFRREEGGWTLIGVLAIILVLSILGTALFYTVSSTYSLTDVKVQKKRAYYNATAGIRAITHWVNQGNDINKILGKETSISHNGMDFDLMVEDVGGEVKLTSIGKHGNFEEKVTVKLEKEENPYADIFDRAINGLEELKEVGGSIVDGDVFIDSSDDGAISLDGGSRLEGEVALPSGSNPNDVIDIPSWTDPSGVGISRIYNDTFTEFLMPDYPDFNEWTLPYKGDANYGWSDPPPPHPPITSSGHYDELVVKEELNINVGNDDVVIRASDLTVKDDGKINVNVNGSGKLVLLVEDEFNLEGEGKILTNDSNPDTDKDWKNVNMYYSGSDKLSFIGDTRYEGSVFAENANIDVNGSGGIIGNILTNGDEVNLLGDADANSRGIIGPNATFTFNGSGKSRGTLYGRKFDLAGGAEVTYDNSMGNFYEDNYFFRDVDDVDDLYEGEDGTTYVIKWGEFSD